MRRFARRYAIDIAAVVFLGVYVVLFLYDQRTQLIEPGWMGDDIRHNAIPSYRYHDTGLFEDDLLTDYMAAFQPVGYKGLYWFVTLWADPIVFSNWLSVGLTLVFAVLVVFAGRHVLVPGREGEASDGLADGPQPGLVAVGAVAAFLLLRDPEVPEWIFGGLPRSFAYPVVAAFLWTWLSGRFRGALATLLVAAAFYPTAFAICAPALGLSLVHLEPAGGVRRWAGLRFEWRRIGAFAATSVVALAIVYPQLSTGDPRIGPVVTLEEARKMPELGKSGLVKEIPFGDPGEQFMEQVGGLFAQKGHSIWKGAFDWAGEHKPLPFLIVLSLLFATGALWLPTVSRRLLLFIGVALAVYALARLLAFRLYVPERILRYALPVAFALLVPAALAALGRRFHVCRLQLAGALPLLLAILVFVCLGNGRREHNSLYRWTKRNPELMSFLRNETAKDTLVAGHPHLMNLVPCLALRKVFYNYETAMPYYRTYNDEMNRRARLVFDAIYARDYAPLRKLRDEEGVDLFVVQPILLGKEIRKHDSWYHMTKYVQGRAKRLRAGKSPLLRPPEEAVLMRDKDVILLDLHQI